MGFSRQEYWSRLPFPPPGDLSDPGIKHGSPSSPALAGRFFYTEPPGKQCFSAICIFNLFNEYLRSKYQSLTDFTSEKVAF